MSDAPSGWKVEQALSAWQSARARLLNDDTDLAHDETALAALLGDEAGSIDEIFARLTKAALHAKAMAEGAGTMIDDLRARQDRYKRRHEQFRATLFAIMDAIGEKKRELPFATLSIKAGTMAAVITDETALPEQYIKTVPSPDKAALTADLKVGVVIPGVELSNGLPSIQIRSK